MPAPCKRIALVLCLAVAFAAGHGIADEHEKGGAEGTPPAPKQGPEHAMLKKMCGEWSSAGKYWLVAGQDPMTFNDQATTRPILNGWHFEMSYTGTNHLGQPWHGRAITSYDQIRKQFVSHWVMDHISTVSISTGKLNDTGEIVLKGDDLHPSDMRPRPSETVHRFVDDDTHVMETWWLKEDGTRGDRMMEIVYTRKK